MVKRVAIGFFGLTRSLKYTIESIKKNFFDVLKENNIEYDVFLHTYDLKVLNLKRSGEKKCVLDCNEWKLLEPYKYQIDNQDDFDKSYNYKPIKKYGDCWKTNFQNVYNLIRQLNSLKQLYKMFETETEKEYDCYILLRPDLLYHDKLDINILKYVSVNKKTLITPLWQRWGGLNDRLAFGSKNIIKLYCNRLDECLNYCKTFKRPLNSEKLLLYITKKNNLELKFTKIRGSRVRANGKIKKERWK